MRSISWFLKLFVQYSLWFSSIMKISACEHSKIMAHSEEILWKHWFSARESLISRLVLIILFNCWFIFNIRWKSFRKVRVKSWNRDFSCCELFKKMKRKSSENTISWKFLKSLLFLKWLYSSKSKKIHKKYSKNNK